LIKFLAVSATVLALTSFAALAQPPAAPAPAAPQPPVDYSKAEAWLCLPGLKTGACASDLSATEISASGETRVAPFTRPAAPAFDCFYVYPTASEDTTPNSDMVAGREIMVAERQFGRYGAVCRQFAPLYRSVTLAALRANTAGNPMAGTDRNLNYTDVVNAWNTYLRSHNNGRGVILVGHSQGAGLLTRLVQNEIEGKPIQRQVIAIHQLGTTIQVPPGRDVGGSYKSIPLCKSPTQTGCTVVYGSYRSTVPPSVNPPARFGRANTAQGTVASCTNPAALPGGKAMLDTYQSTADVAWAKGKTITTPFVRLPGLAQGECVTRGEYTYLEITAINPGEDGPRRNVITGDVGAQDPTWGLHNGDMSVAMGDLVRLAGSQGQAWLAANRR
jgi:hypothetical protein